MPLASWSEKVNVLLASQTLPDAFCGNAIDLPSYGDMFLRLSEDYLTIDKLERILSAAGGGYGVQAPWDLLYAHQRLHWLGPKPGQLCLGQPGRGRDARLGASIRR